MPIDAARYVIIGLTNGPGSTRTRAWPSQVDWVRTRRLMAAAYSVISTPRTGDLETYGTKGPFDASTASGALSNVGYQQAKFNLATMRSAGLQSPDRLARRRAGAGVRLAQRHRGQRRRGPRRRSRLHRRRVRDRRLLHAGAVAARRRRPAARHPRVARGRPDLPGGGPAPLRSGADVPGRPSVLGQWVEDGRDQNVTCPGTSAEMRALVPPVLTPAAPSAELVAVVRQLERPLVVRRRRSRCCGCRRWR